MTGSNDKPTILLQLDIDPHPSVFDSATAIDAGVDRLLTFGGVLVEQVRGLVHGALFTRGVSELNRTAVFVGGSSVAAAESLYNEAIATFFGPFRVSVMLDPNGANTTAAAAALAANEGMGGSIEGARAAVLAGTGPVGMRVARLLARLGADVALGSRDAGRAHAIAKNMGAQTGTKIGGFATHDPKSLEEGLRGASIVVAAGALGVPLLPLDIRKRIESLRVAIDLNAVPPAGIEGIDPGDKKTSRDGVLAWGALGVGGMKMKIHKKAIQELFKANDRTLDAEGILDIGRALLDKKS